MKRYNNITMLWIKACQPHQLVLYNPLHASIWITTQLNWTTFFACLLIVYVIPSLQIGCYEMHRVLLIIPKRFIFFFPVVFTYFTSLSSLILKSSFKGLHKYPCLTPLTVLNISHFSWFVLTYSMVPLFEICVPSLKVNEVLLTRSYSPHIFSADSASHFL